MAIKFKFKKYNNFIYSVRSYFFIVRSKIIAVFRNNHFNIVIRTSIFLKKTNNNKNRLKPFNLNNNYVREMKTHLNNSKTCFKTPPPLCKYNIRGVWKWFEYKRFSNWFNKLLTLFLKQVLKYFRFVFLKNLCPVKRRFSNIFHSFTSPHFLAYLKRSCCTFFIRGKTRISDPLFFCFFFYNVYFLALMFRFFLFLNPKNPKRKKCKSYFFLCIFRVFFGAYSIAYLNIFFFFFTRLPDEFKFNFKKIIRLALYTITTNLPPPP